MRVLTVNAGSSSIRLDLFTAGDSGLQRMASHHGARHDGDPVPAIRQFLASTGNAPVDMAAHRVVHGGERLVDPCLLDTATEREIERLAPLAPLHNPVALDWIRACREQFGAGTPQMAVFDTAFFADLPDVARTYALPRELCNRHAVRRYGFHGLAHAAMWRQWRARTTVRSDNPRVISLQLGSGCSISAIRNGRALDTSMGFSPLEGLVMATRCGDVDAGLLLHLQRHEQIPPARLAQLLNEDSGLRGVSGISGDMRALLDSGEPAARLAVELYCYRARKYVGAYLAVLGGVDAILFGGGVGENAAPVRAGILAGLDWAGIRLDAERNRAVTAAPAVLHSPNSQAEIHVLPVDEAALLAQEAITLVGGLSTSPTQTGGQHA